MSIGVLNRQVYPIIVAVSVITTFLTPVMIRSAGPVYKLLERIMPESWRRYIGKTASVKGPSQSEERLWSVLFKNYAIRLILFSIILFSIIAFSAHFIRPWIRLVLPNLAGRIVMTALAFILMSPFLKALIGWEVVLPSFVGSFAATLKHPFSRKKTAVAETTAVTEAAEPKVPSREKSGLLENLLGENADNLKTFFVSNAEIARVYYELWRAKKANRLPLLVLTSFRLLVISFFIITVVHQFLTENPKVTLILLIVSIVLISRSRWLLDQYIRMEKQFLDNLKGERSAEDNDDK